jgi:hypothetical protein
MAWMRLESKYSISMVLSIKRGQAFGLKLILCVINMRFLVLSHRQWRIQPNILGRANRHTKLEPKITPNHASTYISVEGAIIKIVAIVRRVSLVYEPYILNI